MNVLHIFLCNFGTFSAHLPWKTEVSYGFSVWWAGKCWLVQTKFINEKNEANWLTAILHWCIRKVESGNLSQSVKSFFSPLSLSFSLLMLIFLIPRRSVEFSCSVQKTCRRTAQRETGVFAGTETGTLTQRKKQKKQQKNKSDPCELTDVYLLMRCHPHGNKHRHKHVLTNTYCTVESRWLIGRKLVYVLPGAVQLSITVTHQHAHTNTDTYKQLTSHCRWGGMFRIWIFRLLQRWETQMEWI